MARANHRLVKKLMNELRSRITDRQFFSSRALAGYFEDIAAAQTKRYHYNRRIHVSLEWKPGAEEAAFTDNHYICINCGHPLVTGIRGRSDRFEMVTGLFTHELGHVLFTDFLVLQSHRQALSKGRWFPFPPDMAAEDLRREKALWAYVNAEESNMQMFLTAVHHIINILEDGYIEHRMLAQFPGTLGFGLEYCRNIRLRDMPTVTRLKELEEENGHIFISICQIMLSYALFGEIKYGDEPLSDERIQAVFSLINEIDQAVMAKSAKARLQMVNTITIRLWDYAESYFEQAKEKRKERLSAGLMEAPGEIVGGELAGLAGSSSGMKSGGSAVSEDDAETAGADATAAERAKTHEDAEESSGEKEEPEESPGEKKEPEESTVTGVPEPEEENRLTTGEAEEMSGEGSGQAEAGETSIEAEASGGAGDGGKTDVQPHEAGRHKKRSTSSVSKPEGGTVTRNEEYMRESYEKAASDIERILDAMAEKEACRKLENERLAELNEMAQNISYGNIHEGVRMHINRIDSVDGELVEQYDTVAAPLIAISRQLQKSLVKQLQDRRRGGKMTSLLMGRRMDVHALCRNDGKVFYKNVLPVEAPELAAGLLVDESGSMSSCDRATYARAAAIILHDFCISLGIPVMVYGHSTGHDRRKGVDTVELYSYAEFDGYDNDDRYRLMDISARGSNRDGAALRFVAEQLSKRTEDVKMLILVSDGQPADSGYYGTAAEEDLRGIRQEYMRKGILFVAAAIGEDKEDIERIYGDSFMDISNLNELPAKLTGIVKRHIRV